MSEYLDAISRLEAPERPPMVRYIQKIPFMEYPQHDSEKDWNRIVAQGRNSKLPKYSISQRFYINNNDIDQSVYNFDLDKTFVTAMGDRKSIAIREINFTDNSGSDDLKAVCSTLNPYSIQNIIGNPQEYHDMLNKIYPYDRQNSFQLWFNDAEGNRIFNKNITGYLDLELIVDNSNNINLDV